MRVVFVLPKYLPAPCGGFKVVYEIANRLAARGHCVTLIHPRSLAPTNGVCNQLRAETWPTRTRWRRRPLVPWFQFHDSVSVRLVPDLDHGRFPKADIVVATAWETANAVARCPEEKGRKHLFVQDFEHWATAQNGQRDEIVRALAGPFTRIASSPAVRDMLVTLDLHPAVTVTPAYRPSTYGLDGATAGRDAGTVGFPMRTEHFKGSRDAIAALDLVRRTGEWRVRAFGVLPSPDPPAWVEYLHVPSDAELRAFYNDLAIFILPSHFQGWGITGIEAMACGAALVAADSVGVRPFAIDRKTAMVVPRERPDRIAAAVQELRRDSVLRERIASAGAAAARQYRWSPVVDQVEQVFRA